MADEIKRQAKQQAPQVVQTAAQAMLPRFQQIVDDFAARLADFVTAAGQALHRGISEMLDRALAERRAQGLDVAVRQREIDGQIEELRRLEERLDQIRQSLWAPTLEGDSAVGSA
jgi:uncharacterized protein Yka (UPF0111/DUF47 family)